MNKYCCIVKTLQYDFAVMNTELYQAIIGGRKT